MDVPNHFQNECMDFTDIYREHGGLFTAPTHLLEPEVPWENIPAYVDACREYKVKPATRGLSPDWYFVSNEVSRH